MHILRTLQKSGVVIFTNFYKQHPAKKSAAYKDFCDKFSLGGYTIDGNVVPLFSKMHETNSTEFTCSICAKQCISSDRLALHSNWHKDDISVTS